MEVRRRRSACAWMLGATLVLSCASTAETPSRAGEAWLVQIQRETRLLDLCQNLRKRVEPRLAKGGAVELRKRWAQEVLAPAALCPLVEEAVRASITPQQAREALEALRTAPVHRVRSMLQETDKARIVDLGRRAREARAPVSLDRKAACAATVTADGELQTTVEIALALTNLDEVGSVLEKRGVSRALVRWNDSHRDSASAAMRKEIGGKFETGALVLLQDASDDEVRAYVDFYESPQGRALAQLRAEAVRLALRKGLDGMLTRLLADPKQKPLFHVGWPAEVHPACPDQKGCQTQCDAGQADACQALGVSFIQGAFGAVDMLQGLEAFKRGCTLRLATSCTHQASVVQAIAPTEEFQPEALALLQQACALGDRYGCAVVRTETARDAATRADRPALLRALENAAPQCESGEQPVCQMAAWALAEGLAAPPEPQRADALLRHGCEQGDRGSCHIWADRLYFGWATLEPDHTAARERYRRLCEAEKDMHSCNNLGDMLENGLGGPKDLEQARALYQLACDNGGGSGCWSLGTLHQYGVGVPKDQLQAARLLDLGCKMGTGAACRQLERLRNPKPSKTEEQ